MPTADLKAYNTLIGNLEKLSDGVKIHGTEEGFPPLITVETVTGMKQAVEDKREIYDAAENAARKAYDEFLALFNETETKSKNFATQIYGFYGKKEQTVADFGLKPHKTSGRKGPRQPQTV